MNFDIYLIIATVVSAILYGYYTVMRMDAEGDKRKPIEFWREVFFLCLVLLILRIFYLLFPSMSPDSLFFVLSFIAGGFYLFYLLTLRGSSKEKRKPIYISRDIFICLLVVFVLRGFFFDWFRIPSNSMQPTLTTGDLVLINKNTYGYRLPLLETRLSEGEDPKRGDIIVFRKPREDIFYIKRIIALPGDQIRYGDDKSVSINGERLQTKVVGDALDGVRRLIEERTGEGWHDMLVDQFGGILYQSPSFDHCLLTQTGQGYALSCTVPEDSYFVLGDNRDHSNDSRFWGFVPRENIVGPANYILFNYLDFNNFWRSLKLRSDV